MRNICINNLYSDNFYELRKFIEAVDGEFPVPLSEKSDINILSKKLSENGLLVAAVLNDKIISGCFGYANDTVTKAAYISVVATLNEFRGEGLAEKCVRAFLEHAENLDMESAVLYTRKTNCGAIRLYEKIGFVKIPSDRDGDVKMRFDFR